MSIKSEKRIINREEEIALANKTIDILFPSLYYSFTTLEGIIEYKDYTHLRYVVKPLTLIILIIYYLKKTETDTKLFKHFITFAFTFSLLGDTALMFCDQKASKPDDTYFLTGLICFAIAHVFFILAYKWNIDKSKTKLPVIEYVKSFTPFLFIFTAFILYLWPTLGNQRIPVIFYASLLCLMGSMANSRKAHTNEKSYWITLVGVIIFMISDGLIAFEKFAGWKGRWVYSFIIVSYFVAQYLIVKGMILHSKQYHQNDKNKIN